MSVSIPDPQNTEIQPLDAPTGLGAKVVQLPLERTARRRQEGLRVTQELRRQIALLSKHYAKDATQFQAQLDEATHVAEEAKRQVHAQRAHSAAVEAELFELRGDLSFLRERLAQERRRAARLSEIARLPWWAFARKRWSLASMAADEAR